MGLALSQLPFLDACAESGAFKSPLFALGNPQLMGSIESLQAFAKEHSYPRLSDSLHPRDLFLERYGVETYVPVTHEALPSAEKGLVLDISMPLAKNFVDSVGCILNAGMLEHYFDQRAVFENLHRLLRTGGSFVHTAPLTWYNHGFFNQHAFLFRSLAERNGYEVLVEGYHARMGLFGEEKQEAPHLYLTYTRGERSRHAQSFEDLMYSSQLPAAMLYLVCIRKGVSSQFQIPYDIPVERSPYETEKSANEMASSGSASGGGSAPSVSLPELTPLSIPAEPEPVPAPEPEPTPSPAPEAPQAVLAASVLEDIPMVEFSIPKEEISHEEGFCYQYVLRTNAAKLFSRVLQGGKFVLYEDGVPLREESAMHSDIRAAGEGRVSMWRDCIFFAASDNSDPRSNGKKYSFHIPAFVHFVEQMPVAGKRKFQV